MPVFSTALLLELLAGRAIHLGRLPEVVHGITTDSRAVPSGCLFIALRGEHFDGHDYAADALGRGASLVVADRPVDVPHLRVDDTLVAYQALAYWWRQQFALPVIAVTGSAGKTTTKELLRAVLSIGGPVLASLANENNDIGVAKLLLQLRPEHHFCVVEMGMRGPGEIARLTRCSRPTVAVITNVGSAHIGRLGSQQAIAHAKCELLAQLDTGGTAVLNAEDPLLIATARAVWSGAVVTYGLGTGDVSGEYDGTYLWVQGVPFLPPLPGRHNRLNLLAALGAASVLGCDLEQIRANLANVSLPGGRSRLVHLSRDVQLLDETYNSSPESARAALQLLAELPATRRIAVLGQMRELGDASVILHRQLGQSCGRPGVDCLLVLGTDADTAALAEAARDRTVVERFDNQETLAARLAELACPGDRVLFKASRAVGLERALQRFQKLWETKSLPGKPQ